MIDSEDAPKWAQQALHEGVHYTPYDLLFTGNYLDPGSQDRFLLVGYDQSHSKPARAVLRVAEEFDPEEHGNIQPDWLSVGLGGESAVFLTLEQLDKLIEDLQGIRLVLTLNS